MMDAVVGSSIIGPTRRIEPPITPPTTTQCIINNNGKKTNISVDPTTRRHNNSRRQCKLRSILSMIITTVVYILCFNFVAIKKSGLVASKEDLSLLSNNNNNINATSYDKSFLLPGTRRSSNVIDVLEEEEEKTKPQQTNNNDTDNDNSMNTHHQNNFSTTLILPDTSDKKKRNVPNVVNSSSHVEMFMLSNETTTLKNNSMKTPPPTTIKSSNIPRLPVIPKPGPFPTKVEIINWMQNETNRTAGQILLDFAIIGFAKCGTSTMMVWLDQHKEIFIPQKELNILKKRDAWVLADRLYERSAEDYYGHYAVHDQQINSNNSNDEKKNSTVAKPPTTTNGINIKTPIRFRAYKSPNDVDDMKAIRQLREYYPATKLIVGIRHPISMIESFYNHRVQNGFPIASFMTIGSSNPPKNYGVNFKRAAYHSSLVGLGKTNLNTTAELQLLPEKQRQKLYNKHSQSYFIIPKSPNPVLLYEVGQLKGDGRDLFVEGLENFLGLPEKSLPPPIQIKPGKTNLNVTEQVNRNKLKLDICSKRYTLHRKSLLEIGENVTKWILNYFMKSPDVYISNIDQFRNLLSTYSIDPCEIRQQKLK